VIIGVSAQRDHRGAGGLELAVLIGRLDLDAHELLAVALFLADDLAGAGDGVTKVGDTDEARVEPAQRRLGAQRMTRRAR
jgi:hypothetical protein